MNEMYDFINKVEQQIEISKRNNSRNNWIMAAALIVGFICAVFWIELNPQDHPGTVVGSFCHLKHCSRGITDHFFDPGQTLEHLYDFGDS